MIPPSKPTGPQRGPGNQHAPETPREPKKPRDPKNQREPERQSFPDLQDGPDPAPPRQTSRVGSVRKRVVKPSAPEYRPNPPSSTASSSKTASPSLSKPASRLGGPSPVRASLSAPEVQSHSASAPLRQGKNAGMRTPAASPRDTDAPGRSADSRPSTSADSGPGASADGGAGASADGGPGTSADRKVAGRPDAPGPRRVVPASVPIGLIRRTAVSAATAVVVACTVYMIATRDTGTGLAALDPQAVLGSAGSLIAPAAMMWWLWLPIAAGWLAYALYQWLPQQRENPRQDWVGWLVLASEIMALCWLVAAQSGAAAGMLTVGAVQTALSLYWLHRSNVSPAATRAQGFTADVPLGMFLVTGVFSLTTSLAFLLTRSDADLAGWGADAWAVIALVSVTVGINIVCMTDRGHLAVALAAVWALACVAGERLAGAPESTVIGAAAAAAAFLVLVSAGSRRHQVDHERRRNERRIQASGNPQMPSSAIAAASGDARPGIAVR